MTRPAAVRLFAAVAVGAVSLAGCGLKGDLEAAAPMWGDPNREAGAAPTRIEREDRGRLGDEADVLIEDLDAIEAPPAQTPGAEADADADPS